MMPNLQSDLDSALQSVLENESLTADLDDDAAKVLLDWGMARVRLIHRLAVDATDIEGYISEQMRSTRKLMRAVNHWTAARAEKDDAGHADALGEILAHAGVTASLEQQTAFLAAHLADPPPEFITNLRKFCESR
jgi:hypothetical protein